MSLHQGDYDEDFRYGSVECDVGFQCRFCAVRLRCPSCLSAAVRVAPMPMAASMPLPAPVVSRAPATVAFVNQLENPIQRQNYTLNYAIHLTDGRVLLSDVLPKGYARVALSLVDTTAAG